MNSKKDFMSEHLTNLNEKIKKCNNANSTRKRRKDNKKS